MRSRWARTIAAMTVVALTGVVRAAASEVVVSNAWMRPTLEQQALAPVYFDITSPRPTRIVAITTRDAQSAVIVNADATDDRGTRTNFLLDGGKTVRFAPRGTYVELRSMKRALRNGDTMPLTLILSDANRRKSTVDVWVQVRGLAPPAVAKP